jgi:hypothetical protein
MLTKAQYEVESKMKKYLLATTLILTSSLASADPLPSNYLGKWCLIRNEYYTTDTKYERITTEEELKTCRTGDGYLEIKRDRWEGQEDQCKFTSVKRTGESTPVSTQPRKGDWVPIVRVAMSCSGQGTRWKAKSTFMYWKGGQISIID